MRNVLAVSFHDKGPTFTKIKLTVIKRGLFYKTSEDLVLYNVKQ